jgi:hypothetical protein
VHLDSLEILPLDASPTGLPGTVKGRRWLKMVNGQYQIKIPAISHIISHEFFPPLLNSTKFYKYRELFI